MTRVEKSLRAHMVFWLKAGSNNITRARGICSHGSTMATNKCKAPQQLLLLPLSPSEVAPETQHVAQFCFLPTAATAPQGQLPRHDFLNITAQ
jgi:hypothetical protein